MPGHACGDEITRITLIRLHALRIVCILNRAPSPLTFLRSAGSFRNTFSST